MKLRTATRLVIVGVTVLVIIVALAVQSSRGSSHPTHCGPSGTPCTSVTPAHP